MKCLCTRLLYSGEHKKRLAYKATISLRRRRKKKYPGNEPTAFQRETEHWCTNLPQARNAKICVRCTGAPHLWMAHQRPVETETLQYKTKTNLEKINTSEWIYCREKLTFSTGISYNLEKCDASWKSFPVWRKWNFCLDCTGFMVRLIFWNHWISELQVFVRLWNWKKERHIACNETFFLGGPFKPLTLLESLLLVSRSQFSLCVLAF